MYPWENRLFLEGGVGGEGWGQSEFPCAGCAALGHLARSRGTGLQSAPLALLFAPVQGYDSPGEEVPPAGLRRVQGGDPDDTSERCAQGRGPMPPVALDFSGPDLSEPVDVYSDWIDACEAANQ